MALLPLCTILLFLLQPAQAADPPEIREPPSVTKPRPSEIPSRYYINDYSIVLPCKATGIPSPTYTWTLNGRIVDPHQSYLKRLADGSIEIQGARSRDEGDYQCVASNKYGKSISQVFELRRAKFGRFPADKIVKEFRGVKGQPLVIDRFHFKSEPRPSFNWKIVDNVDDRYPRELAYSRRVTQDLYGNLYFTELTMQDALGGAEFYKVEVFNHELDNSAGGSYSRVIVEDGPDFDQPARLLYPQSKETTVIVLEGDELRLRCIFGSRPAADITWSGPANASRHALEVYDTTYIKSSVTWADNGTYTCTGSNREGTDTATFHVDVNTIPKFTINGKPAKRTLSEGDRVDFVCQTTDDTEPPASITWMFNTEPIDDDMPGQRTEVRKIKNGKVLSINGLKQEDIKVIQCRVSNIWKTLYANAPLNVLLRTELVVLPQDKTVMENDTQVTFMCAATSDPSTKVMINWTHEGRPIQLHDDPRIVMGKGMLTIYFNGTTPNERTRYNGRYGCNASNLYSWNYHEVMLYIPGTPGPGNSDVRTELVVLPEDKMVMENDTQVTFTCAATSDPSTKVMINWTREGRPIQLYDDPRIVKGEGTLTIYFNGTTPNERTRYNGRYGCNASNLYSWYYHEVMLNISGTPEPGNPDDDGDLDIPSIVGLTVLAVAVIATISIIGYKTRHCCMAGTRDGNTSEQKAVTFKARTGPIPTTYEEVHDLITNCRVELLKRCNPTELLITALICKGVISDPDELTAICLTRNQKTNLILDEVVRRGVDAFPDFCITLGEVGQKTVVTEVLGLSISEIKKEKARINHGESVL